MIDYVSAIHQRISRRSYLPAPIEEEKLAVLKQEIEKANREAFEFVRERIMAELDGEIRDEDRITQLDSIVITPRATDSLSTSK